MADIKTILFVDDNPVDRTRLLSSYDFNVILATNANEGMILTEEHVPDLILLDLLLPGISGIELCRKFKAKSALNKILIIFDTFIDTPKHLIEHEFYGAVNYVQKTLLQRFSSSK